MTNGLNGQIEAIVTHPHRAAPWRHWRLKQNRGLIDACETTLLAWTLGGGEARGRRRRASLKEDDVDPCTRIYQVLRYLTAGFFFLRKL